MKRRLPRCIPFNSRLATFIRHFATYAIGLSPSAAVDNDLVILPPDHPFVPEGRFASLLVRDTDLARSLTEGFETLWRKAMRDLREIDFHLGG